jgi:hypothetical protein
MPHIGIGSQAGKIPSAPTVTGVSQVGSAVHVAFTEPNYKGKSGSITNYTSTASPGGATASGTASPLIFSNLSVGTAYNFNVNAITTIGNSTFTGASGANNSAYTPVTPNISVPTVYNTSTTYTPNTYPFSFQVVAVGGGGGGATNVTSGPGDFNNFLNRSSFSQGYGGGGRTRYINATQTINSGSITMSTGAGNNTGGAGGATTVVVNANSETIATGSGGGAGGAASISSFGPNSSSNKADANGSSGAGGAGGSGGGTGLVSTRMNNDYGTNKGGTSYVISNGGIPGQNGGSGGTTAGNGNNGNGPWTAGAAGSGSGSTGTNAGNQIPPGGGSNAANYSGVSIGGTVYFTTSVGRGFGQSVAGDGAVLLIPV